MEQDPKSETSRRTKPKNFSNRKIQKPKTGKNIKSSKRDRIFLDEARPINPKQVQDQMKKKKTRTQQNPADG